MINANPDFETPNQIETFVFPVNERLSEQEIRENDALPLSGGTMTGNLNLGTTEIQSTDGDTDHFFGRVYIGSAATDQAYFAHRDQNSTTNYALRQTSGGITVLNSASGQSTLFTINNSTVFSYSSTEIDLDDTSITSNDANTDFILGRVFLGSPATDQAYFSHRDHNTTTNYAMRQSNAGQTVINAATGQDIFFMINNSTIMTMDASNLDLNAAEITSDDADTAHVFGRGNLGTVTSGTADAFYISHRDQATSVSYAFKQTSAGQTEINAPSGNSILFRISNSTVVTLTSTTLTLGGIDVTTDDDNLDYFFGRAGVGTPAAGTSDVAYFAHRDAFTSSAYAMKQTASGLSTNINAGSAGSIRFSIADTIHVRIDANDIFPETDNAMSCGKSGKRWVDVWAVNSTIQTSDIREKTSVDDSDLGLDFINLLKPISYQWKSGKNTDERHYGLIAQDVKKLMEETGIDSFGGHVDGQSQGLRYSEFISPIVKAIQELSEKVDALSQ